MKDAERILFQRFPRMWKDGVRFMPHAPCLSDISLPIHLIPAFAPALDATTGSLLPGNWLPSGKPPSAL